MVGDYILCLEVNDVNLSNSLNDALCQEVVKEFSNQLAYSQIESYFEDLQLKKLSAYFRKQSEEEKVHANRFIQYINDRTGGSVSIGDVPAPEIKTGNFEIADLYIQIEESTTESIESLYELAQELKSYVDLPFILEMLSEQVKEEDEAQEFALKIRNVKDLVLFDASFS